MPRPRTRLLAGLALLGVVCRGPLSAQTMREVQVPLDPDRAVVEVGQELRRELGLYADIPGFQAARLFRQDDGTLVLDISRLEGGSLVRERQRLTEPMLAAFRADLAERLASQGRTRAVDRSGRTGLVLAESLLGLGLYGWAVPSGFDIDSNRGQVAAYLLTAGLSFYLPYRITRNASVSGAERNAAVWGATRGIAHGLTLAEVLTGPDGPYDPSDPFAGQNDDRVRALSMLGISVAETVISYQTVGGTDASDGEVAFWGAAGDFGIPLGYGLAYLAGLFDEGDVVCEFGGCYEEGLTGTRGGHATALAVALASPVLAHLSGEGTRYTIGDARALRSFGLLGAQVALVPAWAAFEGNDEELDKPMVASMLAGSAAALWLGNRALARRSLSGGNGALVLAGHVAGGLGALGVTYLLDGGAGADPLVYLTTSALGSVAGSLLTLHAVSRGSGGEGGGDPAGARFEWAPEGALLPLFGGRGAARPLAAPLLTIRF